MNYRPIPINERTKGSGKWLFGYLLLALNIFFCFFFKFVRGIIIAIYEGILEYKRNVQCW